MSISVSASILKGVTTYLSALNAKSAVYSDALELIWTSEDGFFRSVDAEFISDAMPIKGEQYLSVTADKKRYAVSVTPLYRSKRLVSGYVCVLQDSTDIYEMVNSSAVSDHARMLMQDIQEKAIRIISVCKVMEELVPEGENREKLLELIRSQHTQSLRIFTELSGNSALVLPQKSEEDEANAVNCHVSALISGLCSEAGQCLVKTKRKLVTDIDIRNCYTKIDYRVLAVAFISMLRSHLYISPLKSNIQISSRFEDGNYIIRAASELLPEEKRDPLQDEKARQDRELARKIAVSDCDGIFSFTEEKNTATSEMTLPIIKKNRGASLNSANSEYLMGSYKPVRHFIGEITEAEEQALNEAREDMTVPAAKSVQKRKKK